MPLMIIPAATYYSSGVSSSADGHSHLNSATLNKLSTDSNGNLCFNGKVVGVIPVEKSYSITLNQNHILQKSLPLPDDCDSSQAITLSLNGISLPRGTFWEVSEQNYPEPDLISWNGLELQHLAQSGDTLIVSFYSKS